MISLVKELELARERVAELERLAHAERQAQLAALPAAYGYATVDDFIRAVRQEVRRAQNGHNGHSSIGEVDPASPGLSLARNGSRQRVASRDAVIEVPRIEAPPEDTAVEAMQIPGAPRGLAAASAPAQSPEPDIAPSPTSTEANQPKSLPTGTSLSDPANFGQLPDVSVLERSSEDETVFRLKVNNAINFAQQVLHTSKVPAAVWREWRDFVRRAGEALRPTTPV